VIEPDLVLEVELLGGEPLLELVELPVRQGILDGNGDLTGDLEQELDVIIRPGLAGSPGVIQRPERTIACDERDRPGRLAPQLHEAANLRRPVAVQIGLAYDSRFAGHQRLLRGQTFQVDVSLFFVEKARPR
jgi:hypothetical protein